MALRNALIDHLQLGTNIVTVNSVSTYSLGDVMTLRIYLRLLFALLFVATFSILAVNPVSANTNEVELEIIGNGPNCDSGRSFNWSDLANSADPYSTMKDLRRGDFYKVTNSCGGGQDLSLKRGINSLLGLQWYSSPSLSDLLAQDHLLSDGSFAYLYIPSNFSVPGSSPGDFKNLIRKPADGALPVFLPNSPFTVGNPITIDTVAPTVDKVTTTASNQTFTSATEILIQVHFSETVIVSTANGSPTLELAVRDEGRLATYQSGSGTSILTFSYVVNSGDNSDDLDFVSTNSLVLNQSVIHDNSSNQANLTLPSPGSLNSLSGGHRVVIDTESPSVEISRQGDQILTSSQDDLVFFNLTENSIDFSSGCVEISGGTMSNFSGSGNSYSAVVTPSENSSGNVIVTVNQGSFSDAIGNRNLSLVSFVIPFNTEIPSVEEVPDVVVNQVAATPQATVSDAVLPAGDLERVSENVPVVLERKTLPRVGINSEQIFFVLLVLLFSGLVLIAISRKQSPIRQKL